MTTAEESTPSSTAVESEKVESTTATDTGEETKDETATENASAAEKETVEATEDAAQQKEEAPQQKVEAPPSEVETPQPKEETEQPNLEGAQQKEVAQQEDEAPQQKQEDVTEIVELDEEAPQQQAKAPKQKKQGRRHKNEDSQQKEKRGKPRKREPREPRKPREQREPREKKPHQHQDHPWETLTHNGPKFAPPYQKLPEGVEFKYDGEVVLLSEAAEEAATFYARESKNRKFAKDQLFNENFLNDWRKLMTDEERNLITDLSKCDFGKIFAHFVLQRVNRRREWENRSEAEKQAIKEQDQKHGVAEVDGNKREISFRFKVQAPGVFKGNGKKRGCIRNRVLPEDVTINCSGEPPKAPDGTSWKEVVQDHESDWLCSWFDNVHDRPKYMRPRASHAARSAAAPAKVRANNKEHVNKKYEDARQLNRNITQIRNKYEEDLNGADLKERQLALAVYFLDTCALTIVGAHEEKDGGDYYTQLVKDINLHVEEDKFLVDLDFENERSASYHSTVSVPEVIYRKLEELTTSKNPEDQLFEINAHDLTSYLDKLLPGLTVRDFSICFASTIFEEALRHYSQEETHSNTVVRKWLLNAYRLALLDVAHELNHERRAPKFLKRRLKRIEDDIKDAELQLALVQADLDEEPYNQQNRTKVQSLTRKCEALHRRRERESEKVRLNPQLTKENFIDPRITVSWCLRYGIPIDKVFSKRQCEMFNWAINFEF